MHIDPRTVQILFADAQGPLVANSRTVEPDALSAASGALAEGARLLGLPMSFSLADQPGGTPPVIDVLRPHATPSRRFLRDCASPFADARLVAELGRHACRTLVIAGFASEVVVLHAALDAIAMGYEVLLPLDAIGSLSARTEAAVIRQIEHAGGTATSVPSLLTMLAPDFAREPGSQVIAAIRALSARP